MDRHSGGVTGRPLDWSPADEAFAAWLAALQASRHRRSRLRFEHPTNPSWFAARRGYAPRTLQYRQLMSELPSTQERTA